MTSSTQSKPIHSIETTKTATTRNRSMPTTANTAPPNSGSPANEAFYRALGQLLSDSVKELLPLVEATDPADSLRLGSDIFSVAAFVAERAHALQIGESEPAFPALTSNVARNFAAALRDWLAEVSAHLAPEVRENLGMMEQLLGRSFKGRDGELLQFMRQIISSDPCATAHAISGLVHIAKWQTQ
jgi:hypothetical protein